MTKQEQKEEYRKEWSLEILKLLAARRSHLNEVLNITKQLSECLDRNDRVSVQMLLKMRATELEQVDEVIRREQFFRRQLEPQTQREIDALLDGEGIEDQSPEMDKIIETARICRKILKDIIEIDKRMSRRIAGKDSFYET